MGTVLRFPIERRQAFAGDGARVGTSFGSIVILPAVRIERVLDDDAGDQHEDTGGRRHGRRRRGSRS